MRYKLDASGYVCAVSFGCYLDDCTEYTGEVPLGYKTLDEWASYSCIQAYYIDMAGNLVLDYAKKIECENKQAQELIDYSPVLRKDLYETDELLNSQYLRKTATGKVIVLEDIKTIAPRVKITGIEPCAYNELRIYTQGKNMMRCDAVSTNISGVTFTKNISGSITILGTATKDIEYIISDGETAPIFALKENQDYYLNLGGMQCELRYFDGETTAQQYVGASGLLNLPKSIEVTQVVIKIAKGETVNTTFYPQLECGPTFTSYDPFKCKPLIIDISEIWNEPLLPSDTLYADDTLYPGVIPKVIDYILIEDGKIIISANDGVHVFGNGSVGLFSSYSTIYATKDVTLEVEYSTNLIDVETLEFLQGKATTTNRFKILEDGSIEAHNGYFSGRIEADSGYFKGEISWEQITGNEDVATMTEIEEKGYQNASQVTKITKDTVTAPFIKTLNLTVGDEISMGDNATISWDKVQNRPSIPSDTSHLTNGAGYQNANQVTTITKNTITTAYINALKIIAGSVAAENITGTQISGKTIVGGEIKSNNYVASSSSYACGGGMRIDLASGNLWWGNGSIKATTGFMNSIGYEVPTSNGGYNLNFKSALAVKGGSLNTLLLGGGYSSVQLPSGANVTSLADKKTNIIPCLNGLSAVENTDVYYFNYKNDSTKRDASQKVGFIIGDGYKLDARLLSEDGEAIDTYNAIALNWRATQQLYEKIKKQQEQIDELKSMLKTKEE